VPIIFIHFPTYLENRPKFHQRGEIIASAIAKIQSKFPQLVVLKFDSTDIEPGCNADGSQDSFPYHFGARTHHALQIKYREAMLQISTKHA
jgi:hypothetical protein